MKLNMFVPITKVDVAKRLVYGRVTEEVVDKSNEIFDYDTGKGAFKAWSDEFSKATGGSSVGNLRSMHKPIAAGKFTDIAFDDKAKTVDAVAKVVDDEEWKKVTEGVYTGFSLGGGYAKRWADPDLAGITRYTPEISEVSLVDNPCVPTAHFTLIKADGVVEEKLFKLATSEPATPPNPGEGVKQVWQAEDGSTHATKAAAMSHNTQTEAEKAAKAAAAPALDALKALTAAVDAKAPAAEPPSTEPAATVAVVAAETPEALAAKLKKGLWHVSRLCSLVDDLNWFAADLSVGRSVATSTIPGELKDMVKSLGDTLKALVMEEVTEMTKLSKDAAVFAMGAGLVNTTALTKFLPADNELGVMLTKIGATKHGKLGKKYLQRAHDALGKLGTVCKAIEAAAPGEEKPAPAEGEEAPAEGEEAPADDAAAAEGEEAPADDAAAEGEEKKKKAPPFGKAVHSRTDQDKLNKAHDLLMEVGAACKIAIGETPEEGLGEDEADLEEEEAAEAEAAAKGVLHVHGHSRKPATPGPKLIKMTAERDAYKGVLDGLTPQITALVERIKKLEDQPLPAKGAKRQIAVSKLDESATRSGGGAVEVVPPDQLLKSLNDLTPEERARLLMKVTLANPQRVG